MATDFNLELPDWIQNYQVTYQPSSDPLKQMRFVLGAVKKNITHKSGGPFAPAIFEEDQGTLLSLGVNLVESMGCSMLHAEVVAIMLAQKQLGHHDLYNKQKAFRLVTSTEPCAMCLGSIPWSGLKKVICGARDEDARAIGFDEGAKPEQWEKTLVDRGIKVSLNVLRDEAKDILIRYHESGGLIY